METCGQNAAGIPLDIAPLGGETVSQQQKDTVESLMETVTIMQKQYEEVCEHRDRLHLGIKCAYHLIMAAEGPEDGPTSWCETATRWLDEFAIPGGKLWDRTRI